MNILKFSITLICVFLSFCISTTIIKAEDSTELNVIEPPKSDSLIGPSQDPQVSKKTTVPDYKNMFKDTLIVGDSYVNDLMFYDILDSKNISYIQGPLYVKNSLPFYDEISNKKPSILFVFIGKDYQDPLTTITIVNTLHNANVSSSLCVVGIPNLYKDEDIDNYNMELEQKVQKYGYKYVSLDEISSDMIDTDKNSLNEYGFYKLLDKLYDTI